MAVVRPELTPDEVEEILEAIGKVPKRTQTLYRARRELARALVRGREIEAGERANMARVRAKWREMSMEDEPLIPQSVSRLQR